MFDPKDIHFIMDIVTECTVTISKLSQVDGGGWKCYCSFLGDSCVGYGETKAEALADFESGVIGMKNLMDEMIKDGFYG